MKRQKSQFNKIKLLNVLAASCCGYLMFISPHEPVEAAKSVATHIGTFEGRTTFTTSSSNGINPGLFIEVMDEDGNLTQYESEDGIITIPDTKEGAYVTQAKLLGKTKYVDEETSEILDTWEEGRNLRLESSENPVLQTVGKNLYSKQANFTSSQIDDRPTLLMKGNEILWENEYGVPGQVVFSIQSINRGSVNPNWGLRLSYVYTDGSRVYTSYLNTTGNTTTFKSDSNKTLDYVVLDNPFVVNNFHIFEDTIQIEYGSEATSYISPQSNTITVNEGLILRGIGDVRDELNLITGELTQRIGKMVIDGREEFKWGTRWNNYGTAYPLDNPTILDDYNFKKNKNFICEQVPTLDYHVYNDRLGIAPDVNRRGLVLVVPNELTGGPNNVDGLRTWLNENPLTVFYEFNTDSVKTVDLTSTYSFKPISKEFIEVTGTITPLVGSVTVPTTSVSFVLNPNEEAGQQFVAPEFSVSNEANAPIRLSLNRFEQTTNILNDVLPDKYDNWEGLNKKESKDIALALVPKMSDGWLSLNEGPRYVAGALSNELGTIKAKSSVDFTFSALHGQAFEETLSPSYRLGFTFEFMN